MSSRHNKKTTELNALRHIAKILYTELSFCNKMRPEEAGPAERKYQQHLEEYPQPTKKLPKEIAYEDL